MGMFTENYTGNRCSDCTWADNKEKELSDLNKQLDTLKDNNKKVLDLLNDYGLCGNRESLIEAIELLKGVQNDNR